jgi:Tol biopolymer transport system component
MLTGRAPFAQETMTETLARILEREPEWKTLPSNTSSNVTRLLHRCLEKDLRHRLHAVADVRIAIEDALLAQAADAAAVVRTPGSRAAVVAWLIAFVAVMAAATVMWSTTRRAPDLASLRLDVNIGSTRDRVSFALSPDGRMLAFVALDQQTPRLWLRPLGQTDTQPLAGTEGASHPFWAPDGRSIGFFADGWLKRVDLTGGRPQLLAQARNPMGGTWSPHDVILYSPNASSPLMRVPAAGGTPAAITRLLSDELSHRFPAFLPDGNRFLFLLQTSKPEDEGVYLGSLSSAAPETRDHLIAVRSAAEFAASDHLVMAREGVLIAVPFDIKKGAVSGEPITIAPQVANDQQRQRRAFSVSASGLVAYRIETAKPPETELVWIERDGTAKRTLSAQGYPTLTRDGRYVVVSQQTLTRTFSNTDIWLIDTVRGTPRQFTFDSAFDISAVWSSDGSRVVFSSNRKGTFDLFEKPASFAHDERVLLETSDNKFPTDWSPDNRVVLFVNEDAMTGDDLWTVAVDKPQERVRLLGGSHAESQGQFSPDGRWLAYRSNESGRWEIYLRPYPGPGSQQLVSRGGDITSRALTYVNAGHNPPMVFRRAAGGGVVARLDTGGPVIGLMEDCVYRQGCLTLAEGDVLVAYTDGISEAMNSADEEWGEERLIEAVRTNRAASARTLIDRLMASADGFAAGATQHDDMTLLVVRAL